jgi:hypothetical protein
MDNKFDPWNSYLNLALDDATHDQTENILINFKLQCVLFGWYYFVFFSFNDINSHKNQDNNGFLPYRKSTEFQLNKSTSFYPSQDADTEQYPANVITMIVAKTRQESNG